MSKSVKSRVEKLERTGASRPGSRSPDETAAGTANRDPKDGPYQDHLLVERCLVGEVAAWEELHNQCHDPLLALIKGMLRTADANLVDEIAARVWYNLVANDGALLTRFDAGRGNRLITFMRAIARDEAKRYFRAEARRKEREEAATRGKTAVAKAEGPASHVLVEEFLTTLSPADRSFCLQHVLAAPHQDGTAPASRPAAWQQTHRLYKKLLAFLGREL